MTKKFEVGAVHTVTDEEARRRLAAAFAILLKAAERRRAAEIATPVQRDGAEMPHPAVAGNEHRIEPATMTN